MVAGQCSPCAHVTAAGCWLQAGRFYQNQPYDESLEVPDGEEVASIYTPSPTTNREHLSMGGTAAALDIRSLQCSYVYSKPARSASRARWIGQCLIQWLYIEGLC